MTPIDHQQAAFRDEARRQLEALEFGEVSSNFHAQTGELKSDAIAIAQVKATLALVEAQEAANEQQRIANLIALALHTGDYDENTDLLRVEAVNALVEWVQHSPDDEHPEIRPGIKEALGL